MSSSAGNEQQRAVRVDADEFAQRVLDALATPPTQVPDIPVNEDISQNKVRCIVALVCNRLGSSPYGQPVLEKDTTYQWAGGLINIRNCANDDRPSSQGRHWTNITFSVAERLRGEASKRPVAYLLSSWHPAEITRLHVWVVPEAIVYKAIHEIPPRRKPDWRSITIFTRENTIRELRNQSPDLTPFYRELSLSEQELSRLEEASRLDRDWKAGRAEDDEESAEEAEIEPNDDLPGSITPETPRAPVDPNVRYWAMGLGEGGRLWEQCRAAGIIAFGCDAIGHLKQYSDKEGFGEALRVHRTDGTYPTNDALACFQFVYEMKAGDYVFAKQGTSLLYGCGVIESDYLHDPNRSEYRNVRKVRWLIDGRWPIPEGARVPLKTLTNVSECKAFLDFSLSLIPPIPPRLPLPTGEAYTIDDALKELFCSKEELQGILDALARKKNLVLQGPPGVGKTFIARRLAYALIGFKESAKVEMVQFHQSYAYEDFIQGWRPSESRGFERRNGIFHEFCRKAQRDQTSKYVFIIDEINRGNLSKILGELMMLIETDKRGPKFGIPLTYANSQDDRFFVPENLYIIGMMNTADRSLAMVDYALRRRFTFVDLEPKFQSPEFSSFLSDKEVAPEVIQLIVTRLTELNSMIVSEKTNLGPGFVIGHSFFCPQETEQELGVDWYRSVIRWEIAPLVREYWFDASDKAEELIARLLE